MASDYIGCPGCDKQLKKTESGRYRKHKPLKGKTADDGYCDFSGAVIQEESCESPSTPPPTATSPTVSSATSSPDDATETASPATSSTDSSPNSKDSGDDASTSATASPALPGATSYANTLNEAVETQTATYRAQVDAALKTPFAQPTPPEYERPTLFSQPVEVVEPTLPPQPAMFAQPAGRKSEQELPPMSVADATIAARLKELFYAYDNRRSADNRSAQTTLGPSELGTPCDRRLALSLMRATPVNPGGDGWAAFVGSCIHAGLEQMFMWADAGTGRFAVEQRLEYPSRFVPKGTTDLIDRTLFMVDDHKAQGRWSRNKLKKDGPSETYRVQAHVYAYGARLRGEKIERVAIFSWPRDEATLDDLYVWSEPYRPDIVKAAFERVEKIGSEVEHLIDAPIEEKALKSAEYNVADACRYCPFFMPGARSITDGCNGRR